MFCPVGFRSAAELWEEFLARRFESIYIETTQGYHRPDYQAFFTRGSPVDVCEHVFLKSLSTVGFHISSPTGDVLRLHVRMQDGKPNLFSTARIYQSALWAAAIEIEGEGKPSYDALEKANFKAWYAEASEHSKLSEAYPLANDVDERSKRNLGWGTPHHSLLHHIQRETFTILEESPLWAGKTASSAQVKPLLRNYGGWAICLDDVTYANAWPDYLAGKVSFYPSDNIDGSASQIGRPRMAAAHAAFEAMDFDKGDLTWLQLVERIERETGERPSPKAFRNWREQAGKVS